MVGSLAMVGGDHGMGGVLPCCRGQGLGRLWAWRAATAPAGLALG
jgi:hypothetical protein